MVQAPSTRTRSRTHTLDGLFSLIFSSGPYLEPRSLGLSVSRPAANRSRLFFVVGTAG